MWENWSKTFEADYTLAKNGIVKLKTAFKIQKERKKGRKKERKRRERERGERENTEIRTDKYLTKN